jgi:CspA family cold shock protein
LRDCFNLLRSGVPSGTVKFFNTNKGYGFIKPDDGGNDVFVSAVEKAGCNRLAEGARISFDVSDRGESARNLKIG